jgi:ribosome-binding protein aMBF1 (putative translation factor)
MITALRAKNRVDTPIEVGKSRQPKDFDRTVAAGIGRCITFRRTLCGLSTEQLGNRLGIDAADVEAYELGDKRISAKLLLDTAKVLRARPIFFFQ